MIDIQGYKLYSFSVGTGCVRTFRLDDSKGVIIDYILGECGAENSPLPKDYYGTVKTADSSIQLLGNRETRNVVVTRDNIVISKKKKEIDDDINDQEVVDLSCHLLPGIDSLIGNPKLRFIGMVWSFVANNAKPRTKFTHPAARHLYDRVSKVQLNPKEFISEIHSRISFRKAVPESVVKKGIEDHYNVIIQFHDVDASDLWYDSDTDDTSMKEDTPRSSLISVDIQRVFDPKIKYSRKILEEHWGYAQEFMTTRIQEILKGINFGE